eukprot:6885500-Lingulodinium_polyedra.AAC.1
MVGICHHVIADLVVRRLMPLLEVDDEGLSFEGAHWFQAPAVANPLSTPDCDDVEQEDVPLNVARD